MKALIQIHIYGGRGHLATLSKHDDIPTGIYSDKPVNSLINLTPTIKADVKFQIDKVSFEDDSTSLLVSERRLQISQLLPTLGIQNFTALMNESELYGWSVEKYIDGINHYFYIGLDNLPMFSSAVFSEVALKLILFFLMATTCLLYTSPSPRDRG